MRWATATAVLLTLGLNAHGLWPEAPPREPTTVTPGAVGSDGPPRPRLVGRRVTQAPRAAASTSAAFSAGPRIAANALLALIYSGKTVSVEWPPTTLDVALAELSEMTGIRFTCTPGVQSEAVSLSALTCRALGLATLLDLLTEASGLEWNVRRDHVAIGLRGEGQQLLAEELVDMQLLGSPDERAAAEALLADAGEPLRLKTRKWLDAGIPPPLHSVHAHTENASARPLRIDYRCLEADAGFLRDIGVDARVSGLCPDPEPLPRGCKSGVVFLDDTQCEVIDRAAAKSERLRVLDAGTLWHWGGEERTTRLLEGGVLTLRPTATEDARFVCVEVRLRFLLEKGVLFSPRCRVVVPDGATLLVCPAESSGGARPHRLLLLRFEVAPE